MKVFRECVETLTLIQHSSWVTLRSYLTKVKKNYITTESSIAYNKPCSCGKVCIGEATRKHEQRAKEHQYACKRGDEKVSAIADHT